MISSQKKKNLYIVLISPHGLIRGNKMELGRDADTGGQTKYVVELARALSEHDDIGRVDLLTRQIFDQKVSSDYNQPIEQLSQKARIVRLPCGPKRYLRKEVLWPYLDSFADKGLAFFRHIGSIPDVIHAHYADGGYVGSRMSATLAVPLVFTGHSLGRVKLKRLLDQGLTQEAIENSYHISQRIEAEEMTLDYAGFEVASTSQEVEEQYKIYDNYQPETMVIIAPGVDLSRFKAPDDHWPEPAIKKEIDRFFVDKDKPIIMALSRPDPRKNIQSLLRAYGESPELQKMANLAIIAGNRDNIQNLDKGARSVLTEILLLIDKYNLYGKVAIPKHHEADEVPELYRLVTKSQGIFVNPALTEPFGLTLIEAAASGAPIVATADGGPRDIIAYCKNGLLIDPLDIKDIQQNLIKALSDPQQWQEWSTNGMEGSYRHFSWQSHVEKYMNHVRKTIAKKIYRDIQADYSMKPRRSSIPISERIIIADVDNTLTGDSEALQRFKAKLDAAKVSIGFCVATGRSLESTLAVLKEWDIPKPEVLITSNGTEIYYAPNLTPDINWWKHINYRWRPDEVKKLMEGVKGYGLQDEREQGIFKISYTLQDKKAPKIRELKRLFRQSGLHVNFILSLNMYLDILPVRGSKGSAVRYFSHKWGIPFQKILVMGDSGNDEGMLRGDMLSVVVGNYSSELRKLRGKAGIYFAKGYNANGIIEGIDYYNFFGNINPHNEIGEDGDRSVR